MPIDWQKERKKLRFVPFCAIITRRKLITGRKEHEIIPKVDL